MSFIKTPCLTTFPDIAPENTVVKVAKSATTKAPDPAFDIRNMFVDTVMYQSIFAPAKDNPQESIETPFVLFILAILLSLLLVLPEITMNYSWSGTPIASAYKAKSKE